MTLPEDPAAQADLATRLASLIDVSEFQVEEDEPGEWTLVYSLVGIQESCDALLTKHFPALLAADDEGAVRDVLTDIGGEIGHLLYHVHDMPYFRDVVELAETLRDERTARRPSR